MKISKRGKDLAVRLPASLVRELDLKSGDEIDIQVVEGRRWVVRRRDDPTAQDFTIGTSVFPAAEQ